MWHRKLKFRTKKTWDDAEMTTDDREHSASCEVQGWRSKVQDAEMTTDDRENHMSASCEVQGWRSEVQGWRSKVHENVQKHRNTYFYKMLVFLNNPSNPAPPFSI